MKCRDAITTGISHLAQNALRAGLSILGILIGIASVLCMMAIGDGAKLLVADQVDKLGGANQFQFTTRYSITRRSRWVRTKNGSISAMLMPLKQRVLGFSMYCQKMKDIGCSSQTAKGERPARF